jgi:hypothetical protein
MRLSRPVTISAPLVAVLVLAAILAIVVARQAATRASAAQPGGDRAGRLSFQPGTAPLDQQAVREAIAGARPGAQRVIDAVDGLVDVRVGPTGDRSVGLTESDGGRYLVTLDLGSVSRRYGARGVARLVLHELGHVVDFALVDDALGARLDAQIPGGWGCDGGNRGACAATAERFAESFAKWATGDIGMNLYLGYSVPPPSSLEDWGRPLVELVDRSAR